MSHYSVNLNDRLSMCPCCSVKDIPQEKPDAIEPNEGEPDVEVLSGDSGSDEEEDTLEAQGYVPLSQNEDAIDTPGATGVEEEVLVTSEPDEKPEVESSNETPSPSSSAFSSSRGSHMGEDEIDLIKSVMANIKLPSSSIPEWAKRVPEEKWKAPLVLSLQQKNSSKLKPEGKSS